MSTILGPDGKPAFTACPNCEAAMARFNEAVKSIIVMRAQARLLNEAIHDARCKRQVDREIAKLLAKDRLKFHLDSILKQGKEDSCQTSQQPTSSPSTDEEPPKQP